MPISSDIHRARSRQKIVSIQMKYFGAFQNSRAASPPGNEDLIILKQRRCVPIAGRFQIPVCVREYIGLQP